MQLSSISVAHAEVIQPGKPRCERAYFFDQANLVSLLK
jgi:hypothetical protein